MLVPYVGESARYASRLQHGLLRLPTTVSITQKHAGRGEAGSYTLKILLEFGARLKDPIAEIERVDDLEPGLARGSHIILNQGHAALCLAQGLDIVLLAPRQG